MNRLLRLCFLALMLALACRSASAHDWYPWECCAGQDCAPVAAAAVRETPRGYVVTIRPGSHPQWPVGRPGPLVLTIPYAKAKPSPDGRFHICLRPDGSLICWFVVYGGA